MKPYYDHGGITIYHGDCREILPIGATLIVTDIPYGISREHSGLREIHYGEWDKNFDCSWVPSALQAATVYVWCAKEQLGWLLMEYRRRGFVDKALAWTKPNPNPMNGQHHWLEAFEVCCFAKQRAATFNAHCTPGLWHCPPDMPRQHPNQKPWRIVADQILASSNEGDVVLDPFMGSGTTLRAAKDLGRKAIGIEIEERYCEIAAERLSQEVLPL